VSLSLGAQATHCSEQIHFLRLYAQQSEMLGMIEGCAVLGDELARWRDECKKVANLISVCGAGRTKGKNVLI
jgi:hypothetical protein